MSKHLHRTNRTTSSTPLGGELEEGEIGLGISTLGTSTNGFNNGRLYIKLANGDVKRFIGLGLPGTTDETLKTKYGGTNNNFSTASVPTVNNTKNLVYFNYDASLNHSLGSVSNDTLLWNVSTNRLSINRSSAATCTLDVGGDLRVQTIPDWTSSFSSTFNILGQNESDEKIYGIPSNTFLSYLSNNSLPSSRISGVVGLDKGGTNTDFTAFGAPSNGSVMFYSTATSGFITNPNFTWNTSSNILTIAGSVIHNAATDTSNNASLVGLDATNKLVKEKSIKQKFNPSSSLQKQLGRILIISDAAHSFGALMNNKRAGSLTDITSFSFHAVKNLTTAEGGALCFDLPKKFDHDKIYKEFIWSKY